MLSICWRASQSVLVLVEILVLSLVESGYQLHTIRNKKRFIYK